MKLTPALGIGISLFIAFFGLKGLYIFNLERLNTQETFVYGQSTLNPGSPASIRILVFDHKTSNPIRNAKAKIKLAIGKKEVRLFEGRTNREGTIDASFKIPDIEEKEANLIVETSSFKGRDKIETPILLKRSYKLLLTTDKPVYQPNQTIMIRILGLNSQNLSCAENQEIMIEVFDNKGNKVFKETKTTDRFGIVSSEFHLADEINMGLYIIRASLGDTISEKNVNVYKYVLPKFKVKIKTDKNYYLPGQVLQGEINAEYFFGKPVASSNVEVKIATFDVGYNDIGRISGVTNKDGIFKFDFKLPLYFVGIPLEKKNAVLFLEAKVKDKTGYQEQASISLVVSKDIINVTIIPESGGLVSDVENIVYVMTTYPDGRPIKTKIRVNDTPDVYETDPLGIAKIIVLPEKSPYKIKIYAVDELGNEEICEKTFEFEEAKDIILLRTDKAIYKAGELLVVDVLSSYRDIVVYIDLVKDRQTILTKSLYLNDTKASLNIDLPNDLFGSIQIHGYRITRNGQIIRDTRLIYVSMSDELRVMISSDKEIYIPGEEAKIIFKVKDEDENPKVSALGVNVVDEAVFFLQEMQPGFERVYFTLEKELLEPKYEIEIHGYPLNELVTEEEKDIKSSFSPISPAYALSQREELRQEAASVLFTSVRDVKDFSLKLEAFWGLKFDEFKKKRLDYLRDIRFSFYSFLLIPLVLLLLLIIKRFKYPDIIFHKKKKEYKDINSVFSLTTRSYNIILLSLVLAIPGFLLKEYYCFILFSAIGLIILTYDTKRVFQRPQRLGQIFLCLFYLCLSLIFKENLWYGVIFILISILLLIIINQIALIRRCLLLEPILKLSIILSSLFLFFLFILPLFFYLQVKFGILGTPGELVTVGIILFFGLLITPIFLNLIKKSYIPWTRFGVFKNIALFLITIVGVGVIIGLLIFQYRAGYYSLPGMIESEMALETPLFIEEFMGKPEKAIFPEKEKKVGFKEDIAVSKEEVISKKEIRVREYFPETLYFNPAVITDGNGMGIINIRLADSITNWKLIAQASSLDGKLGSNIKDILVFQDFFIDINLPRTLTQDDEISIPIAVYNYLNSSQSVRLEIEQNDWSELMDEPKKSLVIETNDVSVVHFRIKVKRIGIHKLTIYGYGEKMSDAVRRSIEVVPNGEEINECINDKLFVGDVKKIVNIPSNAIKGASKILVKIYPGAFSQVVEGLENIFRMPYGCFEQTSSIAYPNVLALNYMKEAGQITPELQMKTEGYINIGYQRLLNFEVEGGGFSLYGEKPASLWLSAYGLMEFNDMKRVYPIDDKIIKRTYDWLISQQKPNGSWEDNIKTTAYTIWALSEGGFRGEEIEKGISYIQNRISEIDDPYTLALCANALVFLDNKAPFEKLVNRLLEMRVEEGNLSYFKNKTHTLSYSYGECGIIETSALVVYALIRANEHLDIVEGLINYLIAKKDPYGTWYSTQATILALKALVSSLKMTSNGDGKITILLDTRKIKGFKITPKDDILHQIDLGDITREKNEIEIRFKGKGVLFYQIASKYYLPWRLREEAYKPLEIEVGYDKTKLAQDDIVTCQAKIFNNQEKAVNMIIVDLGIPPGFELETQDLKNMVTQGLIKRFQTTGRQIIIYIESIEPKGTLNLTYRLKAKFPIKAKTPIYQVYEYYNPEIRDTAQPIQLNVL